MFLSLSSFSQTDIKIQKVLNSDSIKLHKDIAKKIVKDLMYLDVLKQERIFLLENIDTLNKEKDYKDSIIKYKDYQIKEYKYIIDIDALKEARYRSTVTVLNNKLKKEKLASKISFGLIAIAVGFILIK